MFLNARVMSSFIESYREGFAEFSSGDVDGPREAIETRSLQLPLRSNG